MLRHWCFILGVLHHLGGSAGEVSKGQGHMKPCEGLCQQLNKIPMSSDRFSSFATALSIRYLCKNLPERVQSITSNADKFRILIAPCNVPTSAAPLYQLSYDTGKISRRPYPYIHSTCITALAVLLTQKKLVVSRSCPVKYIESYEVDTGENTNLVGGFSARSMAVDEESHLVFACNTRKFLRIHTDDNNTKTIHQSRRHVVAVAVLPEHRRLYIAFQNQLGSCDYEGRRYKRIASLRWPNILSVESTGNELYSNYGRSLYKCSLDDCKKQVVKRFSHHPSSLVKVGEEYLVTFLSTQIIYFLDKAFTNVISVMTVYPSNVTSVLACVIPQP